MGASPGADGISWGWNPGYLDSLALALLALLSIYCVTGLIFFFNPGPWIPVHGLALESL